MAPDRVGSGSTWADERRPTPKTARMGPQLKMQDERSPGPRLGGVKQKKDHLPNSSNFRPLIEEDHSSRYASVPSLSCISCLEALGEMRAGSHEGI